MKKRLHIFVSGIVQGVFFRQSTSRKAKELGVFGWVKNLKDGRVEIVCEGDEEDLKKMAKWCEKGPEGAYVQKLDLQWEAFRDEFNDFRVTY